MLIISSLLELPIMTEKIETGYFVRGFIFCQKPMKILGLSVATTKKDRGQWAIPLKRVKEFLQEMIVIHHEQDIVEVCQFPDLTEGITERIPFHGFDILDYQGRLVGIVKDIVFDESTGTIKGFIISQGYIDDLTVGYQILPLIPYLQVEAGEIRIGEIELETLLLTQRGGLQKLLGIDREN